MKKGLITGLAVVILIILITLGVLYFSKKEIQEYAIEDESNSMIENIEENTEFTIRAVILKIDKARLIIYGEGHGLLSVGFKDEEDIGYKVGQEILIYYDGMIFTTYPGQIDRVEKIEIVKEESNIEIPDRDLRFCYTSRDNVSVDVSNLTCNGITLNITDTNELKYDYTDSNYTIKKEVKNENYTGEGYFIGEATEYSTPAYVAPGFEYIFEEMDKISNVSSKDTEKIVKISEDKIEKTFDWTELYGKLDVGKYEFILHEGELGINISFSIDTAGNAIFSEVEILY